MRSIVYRRGTFFCMQPPPPDLEWATYGAALTHRARELRRRLKLTQEELSERSGVSRNMIQNIERGHATGKPGDPTNPTMKTLYSLSYALEAPPAVLLPDLASKVRQRSPSAATSPGIEEILRVDIAWPADLDVELPE